MNARRTRTASSSIGPQSPAKLSTVATAEFGPDGLPLTSLASGFVAVVQMANQARKSKVGSDLSTDPRSKAGTAAATSQNNNDEGNHDGDDDALSPPDEATTKVLGLGATVDMFMEGDSAATVQALTLLAPEEAAAFYRQKCRECGVKANSTFLRALQSEPSIVNFSNNYFGDRGMLAIAPTLERIPVIQLDLRNTVLTFEDTGLLHEALLRHPTLTSIDLRDMEVSVASSRRWLSLVIQNRRLTTLQLDDGSPKNIFIQRQCLANADVSVYASSCVVCGASMIHSITLRVEAHILLRIVDRLGQKVDNLSWEEFDCIFRSLVACTEVNDGVLFLCSTACVEALAEEIVSACYFVREAVDGTPRTRGHPRNVIVSRVANDMVESINAAAAVTTGGTVAGMTFTSVQNFRGGGGGGPAGVAAASAPPPSSPQKGSGNAASAAAAAVASAAGSNGAAATAGGDKQSPLAAMTESERMKLWRRCDVCGTNALLLPNSLSLVMQRISKDVLECKSQLRPSAFARLIHMMLKRTKTKMCSSKCVRTLVRFCIIGYYGALSSHPSAEEPSIMSLTDELPLPPMTSFAVVDFNTTQIFNDGEEDTTCASAVASALGDIDGEVTDPHYIFAAGRHIANLQSVHLGMELRHACQAVLRFGGLALSLAPLPLSAPRRAFADWATWEKLPNFGSIRKSAFSHRKHAYFQVSGPHDNVFDNLRAALWRFREQRKCIVTTMKWRTQWLDSKDGMIPTEKLTGGFDTALKVVGQVVIDGVVRLILQPNFGTSVGNKGFFYAARTTVNRGAKYGAYMFIDTRSVKENSGAAMAAPRFLSLLPAGCSTLGADPALVYDLFLFLGTREGRMASPALAGGLQRLFDAFPPALLFTLLSQHHVPVDDDATRARDVRRMHATQGLSQLAFYWGVIMSPASLEWVISLLPKLSEVLRARRIVDEAHALGRRRVQNDRRGSGMRSNESPPLMGPPLVRREFDANAGVVALQLAPWWITGQQQLADGVDGDGSDSAREGDGTSSLGSRQRRLLGGEGRKPPLDPKGKPGAKATTAVAADTDDAAPVATAVSESVAVKKTSQQQPKPPSGPATGKRPGSRTTDVPAGAKDKQQASATGAPNAAAASKAKTTNAVATATKSAEDALIERHQRALEAAVLGSRDEHESMLLHVALRNRQVREAWVVQARKRQRTTAFSWSPTKLVFGPVALSGNEDPTAASTGGARSRSAGVVQQAPSLSATATTAMFSAVSGARVPQVALTDVIDVPWHVLPLSLSSSYDNSDGHGPNVVAVFQGPYMCRFDADIGALVSPVVRMKDDRLYRDFPFAGGFDCAAVCSAFHSTHAFVFQGSYWIRWDVARSACVAGPFSMHVHNTFRHLPEAMRGNVCSVLDVPGRTELLFIGKDGMACIHDVVTATPVGAPFFVGDATGPLAALAAVFPHGPMTALPERRGPRGSRFSTLFGKNNKSVVFDFSDGSLASQVDSIARTTFEALPPSFPQCLVGSAFALVRRLVSELPSARVTNVTPFSMVTAASALVSSAALAHLASTSRVSFTPELAAVTTSSALTTSVSVTHRPPTPPPEAAGQEPLADSPPAVAAALSAFANAGVTQRISAALGPTSPVGRGEARALPAAASPSAAAAAAQPALGPSFPPPPGTTVSITKTATGTTTTTATTAWTSTSARDVVVTVTNAVPTANGGGGDPVATPKGVGSPEFSEISSPVAALAAPFVVTASTPHEQETGGSVLRYTLRTPQALLAPAVTSQADAVSALVADSTLLEDLVVLRVVDGDGGAAALRLPSRRTSVPYLQCSSSTAAPGIDVLGGLNFGDRDEVATGPRTVTLDFDFGMLNSCRFGYVQFVLWLHDTPFAVDLRLTPIAAIIEQSYDGVAFVPVAHGQLRASLCGFYWDPVHFARFWRVTLLECPVGLGICRVLWYNVHWVVDTQPYDLTIPFTGSRSSADTTTTTTTMGGERSGGGGGSDGCAAVRISAPWVYRPPGSLLQPLSEGPVFATPASPGAWRPKHCCIPSLAPSTSALFVVGTSFCEIDLTTNTAVENRSCALGTHPAFSQLPFPFNHGLESAFYPDFARSRNIVFVASGMTVEWNLEEGVAVAAPVPVASCIWFADLAPAVLSEPLCVVNNWDRPGFVYIFAGCNVIGWNILTRTVVEGPCHRDDLAAFYCPSFGGRGPLLAVGIFPQKPLSTYLFLDDCVAVLEGTRDHRQLVAPTAARVSESAHLHVLSRYLRWGLPTTETSIVFDLGVDVPLLLGVSMRAASGSQPSTTWEVSCSSDLVEWRHVADHEQRESFAETQWSPDATGCRGRRYWRLATSNVGAEKEVAYDQLQFRGLPSQPFTIFPLVAEGTATVSGGTTGSGTLEFPCISSKDCARGYAVFDYGEDCSPDLVGLTVTHEVGVAALRGGSPNRPVAVSDSWTVSYSDDGLSWEECGTWRVRTRRVHLQWAPVRSHRFYRVELCSSLAIGRSAVFSGFGFSEYTGPSVHVSSARAGDGGAADSASVVSPSGGTMSRGGNADEDVGVRVASMNPNGGSSPHAGLTALLRSCRAPPTRLMIPSNATSQIVIDFKGFPQNLNGLSLHADVETFSFNTTFAVEYSDDNDTWHLVSTAVVCDDIGMTAWENEGAHRFWRMRVTRHYGADHVLLLRIGLMQCGRTLFRAHRRHLTRRDASVAAGPLRPPSPPPAASSPRGALAGTTTGGLQTTLKPAASSLYLPGLGVPSSTANAADHASVAAVSPAAFFSLASGEQASFVAARATLPPRSAWAVERCAGSDASLWQPVGILTNPLGVRKSVTCGWDPACGSSALWRIRRVSPGASSPVVGMAAPTPAPAAFLAATTTSLAAATTVVMPVTPLPDVPIPPLDGGATGTGTSLPSPHGATGRGPIGFPGGVSASATGVFGGGGGGGTQQQQHGGGSGDDATISNVTFSTFSSTVLAPAVIVSPSSTSAPPGVSVELNGFTSIDSLLLPPWAVLTGRTEPTLQLDGREGTITMRLPCPVAFRQLMLTRAGVQTAPHQQQQPHRDAVEQQQSMRKVASNLNSTNRSGFHDGNGVDARPRSSTDAMRQPRIGACVISAIVEFSLDDGSSFFPLAEFDPTVGVNGDREGTISGAAWSLAQPARVWRLRVVATDEPNSKEGATTAPAASAEGSVLVPRPPSVAAATNPMTQLVEAAPFVIASFTFQVVVGAASVATATPPAPSLVSNAVLELGAACEYGRAVTTGIPKMLSLASSRAASFLTGFITSEEELMPLDKLLVRFHSHLKGAQKIANRAIKEMKGPQAAKNNNNNASSAGGARQPPPPPPPLPGAAAGTVPVLDLCRVLTALAASVASPGSAAATRLLGLRDVLGSSVQLSDMKIAKEYGGWLLPTCEYKGILVKPLFGFIGTLLSLTLRWHLAPLMHSRLKSAEIAEPLDPEIFCAIVAFTVLAPPSVTGGGSHGSALGRDGKPQNDGWLANLSFPTLAPFLYEVGVAGQPFVFACLSSTLHFTPESPYVAPGGVPQVSRYPYTLRRGVNMLFHMQHRAAVSYLVSVVSCFVPASVLREPFLAVLHANSLATPRASILFTLPCKTNFGLPTLRVEALTFELLWEESSKKLNFVSTEASWTVPTFFASSSAVAPTSIPLVVTGTVVEGTPTVVLHGRCVAGGVSWPNPLGLGWGAALTDIALEAEALLIDNASFASTSLTVRGTLVLPRRGDGSDDDACGVTLCVPCAVALPRTADGDPILTVDVLDLPAVTVVELCARLVGTPFFSGATWLVATPFTVNGTLSVGMDLASHRALPSRLAAATGELSSGAPTVVDGSSSRAPSRIGVAVDARVGWVRSLMGEGFVSFYGAVGKATFAASTAALSLTAALPAVRLGSGVTLHPIGASATISLNFIADTLGEPSLVLDGGSALLTQEAMPARVRVSELGMACISSTEYFDVLVTLPHPSATLATSVSLAPRVFPSLALLETPSAGVTAAPTASVTFDLATFSQPIIDGLRAMPMVAALVSADVPFSFTLQSVCVDEADFARQTLFVTFRGVLFGTGFQVMVTSCAPPSAVAFVQRLAGSATTLIFEQCSDGLWATYEEFLLPSGSHAARGKALSSAASPTVVAPAAQGQKTSFLGAWSLRERQAVDVYASDAMELI